MKPITHILVPTDFSAASHAALEAGITLAQQFGAQLTLLHVVEPQFAAYAGMPFMPVVDLASEVEQAAWAGLKAEEAKIADRVKVSILIRRGSTWQEILQQVTESGADLIVMSTQGHTGLARALLGSTAEKIVRLAEIPVLTVHAAATAA